MKRPSTTAIDAGGKAPLPTPLDDRAARLDPAAFAEEQRRLGQVWTFLGFAHQVENRDDWFRAELGGRSVIVQRFEAGLSGFENRCAHRGYPLRLDKHGNGALVCGFHHWRYNAEGLALGIPECPAMFGKTPRELDARLKRVDLAQVGGMIFGRFAGGEAISIEDWLGPAFPILAHVTRALPASSGRFERVIAANWRYMMDISLDDYHIVAVHPSTFGKSGYLSPTSVRYARFGAHSAYLPGSEGDALGDWARECAGGTYRPTRYRILQLFPTLIVAVVRAANFKGEGYWFLTVQHLIPEAHDRTRSISRFFPIPHMEPASAWHEFSRKLTWPGMKAGYRYYAGRVHGEDNVVTEHLQANARADDPPPRLASQELRIGWFAQSYRRVLAGEVPAAHDIFTN